MCRDLQQPTGRRESLRRDVENRHHPSRNQYLTPGVAESNASVVEPHIFLPRSEARTPPPLTSVTPPLPAPTPKQKIGVNLCLSMASPSFAERLPAADQRRGTPIPECSPRLARPPTTSSERT